MPPIVDIPIPSTAIYIDRNTVFHLLFRPGYTAIAAANSGAIIRALILREDGNIEYISFIISSLAYVSANRYKFSLPEGHLFSLSLSSTNGILNKGDFYCQIHLLRFIGSTAISTRVILSGWLYYYDTLSYPEHSFEEPGPDLIPCYEWHGVPPAVGNPIIEAIPDLQDWNIIGLRFQLTTNTAVAGKVVQLDFLHGADYQYSFVARTTQPGLSDYYYFCYPYNDLPADAVPNIYIPIPRLKTYPSMSIETFCSLLSANDQFGALSILYQQGFRQSF